MNPRRSLCGLLITAGAMAAGTAFAADPEGGKVDSATPRIDWKGSVTASWVPSRAVILADAAGESGNVPCEAPTCDTFALEVGEKKDMTVGVTSPEAGDQVILRIKTPADEYVTTVGDTDSKAQMTVKFKAAAPGTYTVDYWNYYTSGTQEYAGWAQLAVPAAPPAAPPTTSPGNEPPQAQQPPTQTGQPQPQPGQTEAIAMSVKVGKASAKKLKKARKLKAKVTVSRPATVTGFFKKGKKTIAKGKATVKASGTLTLKLSKKAAKKLKKGKYALTVTATDGKTTTAKTVKVTVRK